MVQNCIRDNYVLTYNPLTLKKGEKQVKQFPFVVILDDIRSALNVGAIFRTCDGAGVEKLYLTGITPYPPHNRIPKTALGAIEHVEWGRVVEINDLISKLKNDGYTIYAVEQTESSQLFHGVDYPEKSAVIFGNEISGVSEKVLQLSDHVIEIPMFGQKNSLNVATTAGIILYNLAMHFHGKE